MHKSIYKPEQDSFFFADFLKKYFSKLKKPQKQKIKYLDMGTGSGILSKIALNSEIPIENILAIDINQQAVDHVKKTLKIKSIKSDLFKNPKLKNQKFDIITFNAPYLPEDKREPKQSQTATTGGKNGDEASLKFIKQAKKHLSPKAKIFLLISSLTPLKRIKKFNPKTISKKKIFFEELFILEFD